MSSEKTFDLKATVNLPKTSFAQKANLTQREPERLARWQKMNLYQEIRRARAGHPMFVLHDGPPYANADIHIGTAMNKILKDFVVKSHSMMGYDAPYVPGYDCHGLPIELFVDKKLGAKKSQMSPVSSRVPRARGRGLEAADSRLSTPGDSRRVGRSVPYDVQRLRGADRAIIRTLRRARLRLQRRAAGLLVHTRSDGARRS